MLFINLRPTYVWALLSSVLLNIHFNNYLTNYQMDFILVIFVIVNPHEGWQWKSFYVVQRNKDCNVQPDAAAQVEAGACLKKNLMMTQKW
jgi:hypothetical protein